MVLFYVSGPPLAGTQMYAVSFFSRSSHQHFTAQDDGITFMRFNLQDIQSKSRNLDRIIGSADVLRDFSSTVTPE